MVTNQDLVGIEMINLRYFYYCINASISLKNLTYVANGSICDVICYCQTKYVIMNVLNIVSFAFNCNC